MITSTLLLEEAISLDVYHDPVKNTLWYLSHTEDRASVLLADPARTRLDLSPDPSGRWKLDWVRDGGEIYSVWLYVQNFNQALEIFQMAVRTSNRHPEILSAMTWDECDVHTPIEMQSQLRSIHTLDIDQARQIERALVDEAHRGVH